MILGGFEDYSGEDEMRPYVDIGFRVFKQSIQTSWCASPGNHATVVLVEEDMCWDFLKCWKKLQKEQYSRDNKVEIAPDGLPPF